MFWIYNIPEIKQYNILMSKHLLLSMFMLRFSWPENLETLTFDFFVAVSVSLVFANHTFWKNKFYIFAGKIYIQKQFPNLVTSRTALTIMPVSSVVLIMRAKDKTQLRHGLAENFQLRIIFSLPSDLSSYLTGARVYY